MSVKVKSEKEREHPNQQPVILLLHFCKTCPHPNALNLQSGPPPYNVTEHLQTTFQSNIQYRSCLASVDCKV